MPLWAQYGILKIMYRILCKTEEVDPIKLVSRWQTSVFKYIFKNSVLKYTESGHRWLKHFLISIENIYNRYIVLLAKLYTKPLSPVTPKSIRPWDYQTGLVRYTIQLYNTVCLFFFQRTHFFHWLPKQMPCQHFQCFDFWLFLIHGFQHYFISVAANSAFFCQFLLPVLKNRFFFQKQNHCLTLYQTTKFNPLLHKYSFWCINNRQLLKTLWEKEKLLVRAISPFPTMFSTQSDNFIFICPYFWHHIFICCGIGSA